LSVTTTCLPLVPPLDIVSVRSRSARIEAAPHLLAMLNIWAAVACVQPILQDARSPGLGREPTAMLREYVISAFGVH